MQTITSILRSLVALLVFAGVCAAQEPNVEGTATFPSDTYACVLEDANTEDSSGTGTVQPNPEGQPPGPVLTVRWDKVMIEGVEWIEISRDQQLLGRVCPSTGDAWLNSGGAGQEGSWQ